MFYKIESCRILPIYKAKSNVQSVGPYSERNILFQRNILILSDKGPTLETIESLSAKFIQQYINIFQFVSVNTAWPVPKFVLFCLPEQICSSLSKNSNLLYSLVRYEGGIYKYIYALPCKHYLLSCRFNILCFLQSLEKVFSMLLIVSLRVNGGSRGFQGFQKTAIRFELLQKKCRGF